MDGFLVYLCRCNNGGMMLEIFFEGTLIRLSDNPAVVEAFFSSLKVIEAAGGLVWNEKDELLWIYRRGRWDLPKGKVEKWASGPVSQWASGSPLHHLKSEAVREVQEETGLSDVEVGALIEPTLHVYSEPERYVKKGETPKLILKITWWFAMRADSHQALKPQEEEDITKVCWVPRNELGSMLENTYGNIRKLIAPLHYFKKSKS